MCVLAAGGFEGRPRSGAGLLIAQAIKIKRIATIAAMIKSWRPNSGFRRRRRVVVRAVTSPGENAKESSIASVSVSIRGGSICSNPAPMADSVAKGSSTASKLWAVFAVKSAFSDNSGSEKSGIDASVENGNSIPSEGSLVPGNSGGQGGTGSLTGAGGGGGSGADVVRAAISRRSHASYFASCPARASRPAPLTIR